MFSSHSNRSELHPVIHYRDLATTLQNAEIAAAAGCAGVFLIHHKDGRDYLLDPAIALIRARCPGLIIGVNRLSTAPLDALRRNLELGVDHTWCDTCGISSRGVAPLARQIQGVLREHLSHKFFGSVAFKHQPPEANPPLAAQFACAAGFVPTTSGAATGSAPSVEKIAGMAGALGGRILAVASGITAENAAAFVPHLRYFLVSTGISSSFHEFDAAKVEALARIIQGPA